MVECFVAAVTAVALAWLTLPILAWHSKVQICVTFRNGGRWCCGRRLDNDQTAQSDGDPRG